MESASTVFAAYSRNIDNSEFRIPHSELILVVFFHSGNKAAKSDLCRTKVVYFVDLKLGVELSAAFEDPSYLVRCDSIDAAAERYKLYKLHILLRCDILRCTVKS